MKNAFSLSILLLLATVAFAQKNVVKGHAFWLPTNPVLHSIGFGYERMVTDFWSVQGLVNNNGRDRSRFDGEAEFTNAVVAEARYYFGKKRKETLNRAAFFGLFMEGDWTKIHDGGELPIGALISPADKRTSFGPGLVLGKNFPLSTHWFIEFYGGPKYRFVDETRYYFLDNLTLIIEKRTFDKWAIRLGCNIGFRF